MPKSRPVLKPLVQQGHLAPRPYYPAFPPVVLVPHVGGTLRNDEGFSGKPCIYDGKQYGRPLFAFQISLTYFLAYRTASTNPRCTALLLMLWSLNLSVPLRICYIVCYGFPKTILLRVLHFLKLKDESFQYRMTLLFLRYIIS